jgi:hypothetical protein
MVDILLRLIKCFETKHHLSCMPERHTFDGDPPEYPWYASTALTFLWTSSRLIGEREIQSEASITRTTWPTANQ